MNISTASHVIQVNYMDYGDSCTHTWAMTVLHVNKVSTSSRLKFQIVLIRVQH